MCALFVQYVYGIWGYDGMCTVFVRYVHFMFTIYVRYVCGIRKLRVRCLYGIRDRMSFVYAFREPAENN